MPTYEYKCRDCGHRFEIVQSFTDKPLTKCKECKGSLGKVFGSIGITFKGSGFYKTDSRSGSASVGSSKSNSESSKSESKSEGKSETKSDSGKSDGAKPAAKETKAKSKESAA